ncbi:serine/threonine-protein kinase [Streptomyces sp. NPDC058646]|uniref:serine/threonine-protein kinase n=1 Tax=Streptomyces sp. NPDC058646 TaxID=3346574 RepID=UPI003647E5EF
MAEVWKAKDLRLDRPVVAKFLQVPGRGSHPALRFLREAKILAGIDDPRIVRIHDVDEARIDGLWHLYLITQFIEGRTLRAAVPKGHRLPVAHALSWAAELCDALVPVHAQHLVHRDVKPGNVMVSGAPGAGRLVLLDFGIARSYTAVGELGHAAGVTGYGQLLGTPEYMAPERFLLKPVTPATDLYSVGCVLFEMLTGRQPYVSTGDYGDLAREHCHAPVPSVRALRPEVPPSVALWVTRLLAKDPGRRPAHAGEVAAVLRALGAAATPPTPTVVVGATVPPPPGPPPGPPADPAAEVEALCNAALAAPSDPAERVGRLGEVLDHASRVLPADHRGGWLVVLHLAQALARADQPGAAAGLLAPMAARARQVLGADDELARLAALNLARYLGEDGYPALAAQHLLELRTAVSGVLAATDPRMSEIRYDTAHWLAAAGEEQLAAAEFEALYADHWTAYGVDHPETVRLGELIHQHRHRSSGRDEDHG